MEAVNAHLARVLADCAVTAARPANEAKLRQLLEEQGHRATATIFEAIKEDRCASTKPGSHSKRVERQQGGKRDEVYFLQTETDSTEGSQCGSVSDEPAGSVLGRSGLNVTGLETMEDEGRA